MQQALAGRQRGGAICTDCYIKKEITIDFITSLPFSKNNLILTGSHVIYGTLGGHFYSLTDINEQADYSLVAADPKGLVAFYSGQPTKQVLVNEDKVLIKFWEVNVLLAIMLRIAAVVKGVIIIDYEVYYTC